MYEKWYINKVALPYFDSHNVGSSESTYFIETCEFEKKENLQLLQSYQSKQKYWHGKTHNLACRNLSYIKLKEEKERVHFNLCSGGNWGLLLGKS